MKTADWFVLAVMTGRERAVVEGLGDAGMEGWAPEAARWRRYGRMRRISKGYGPLLPGYVFLAEACVRWPAVRGLDGVYGVVGVRGVPGRIGGAAVERIRAAVAAGLYDEADPAQQALRARTLLRVGARVEVVGTAFDGLAGRLVANAGGKARVDLAGLGVVIPLDNLKAAA